VIINRNTWRNIWAIVHLQVSRISPGTTVLVDGARRALVECEGDTSGCWDICWEDNDEDELNVPEARMVIIPDQPTTADLCGNLIPTDMHYLKNGQGVARHKGRLHNSIRIVVISDTHGLHRELALPSGDILVHAGDFSNAGEQEQIFDLATWFGTLPHQAKVVIAGNHDITMDKDYYAGRGQERFHANMNMSRSDRERKVDEVRKGLVSAGTCLYLEDQAASVCGISSYGSPWQPEFCDWAFNLARGAECRDKWKQIPQETDMLITHGPPLGHGDKNSERVSVGCADLADRIKHVKPRLHLFGHVHEGYGCTADGQTLYVNASNCDHSYRTSHLPIVVDLPLDRHLPPSVCLPATVDWNLGDIKTWLMQNRLGEFVPNFEVFHRNLEVKPGEPFNMFAYDIHNLMTWLKPGSSANYERLSRELKRLYAESFL